MTLNIIIVLVLLSLVVAWMSLAPWVPTRAKDLVRIQKIIALQPGQIFLEMGCGNGRVCKYIAEHNPRAKVLGIELALIFYLLTKIRIWITGPENLEIKFGNALKYDISNVDVIYVFGLIETINAPIKKKVLAEMKPGAKLVSYNFAMKKWPGKTTQYKETPTTTSIYVYEK